MSPRWNFLSRVANVTRMPNRKDFPENYELVFPKHSAAVPASFSLAEKRRPVEGGRNWNGGRKWHASAGNLRGDCDFFGTRPEGKLFPLGSRRCSPMLVSSRSRFIVFASRPERITYDNCRERPAFAHSSQIRARCYPILSFNPFN